MLTKNKKYFILTSLNKKTMELKMLNFRNTLPETVQVPDNEKRQIALLVCQEIDEMLYLDNGHYDWFVSERLDDLFRMDDDVTLMLSENLSVRMNKSLRLTETDYKFENLTVNQLIDVVYAKYNDLPLPDFTRPTLIQRFKRCFGLDKQKTRE